MALGEYTGVPLALLLVEVLAAAVGQFALLLELGRARLFGVLYLCWPVVLKAFVLIEFATR